MMASLTFFASLVAALVLQLVALPDWAALARPSWPLLVIGYWALRVPHAPAVVSAWLLGICCDVLLNAPLGQHALGLVVAAALIRRLSGVYILFPVWQAALALIPVWVLYEFLMFWIDGLARHASDTSLRWAPIIATSLAWPLYAGVLDGIRARRARARTGMRLP